MKKKYIHVYLIQKYIKDMLKCPFLDHAVYIYIYIYIYIFIYIYIYIFLIKNTFGASMTRKKN